MVLIAFLHYIRFSMRRHLFASSFIFIIGTQVLPVQGFQVWYNLLKFENNIEAPMVQKIQEKSLEESQLKLKITITSTRNYLRL